MHGRTLRSRCAAKAHRRAWEPSRAACAGRRSCQSGNSAEPNYRGADARFPLRCVSLPRNASPDEVLALAAYRHCTIHDIRARGTRARVTPAEGERVKLVGEVACGLSAHET